jgi:hypothetical protein
MMNDDNPFGALGEGFTMEDTNNGELAAMLQQNPGLVLEHMMDRYREERKRKDRVKCPACNRSFGPVKNGQRSVCAHVSHNALEIWVPAPCPICLEVSQSLDSFGVALAARCAAFGVIDVTMFVELL